MAEFSIIQKYCQKLGVKHDLTKLGIGDDAAIINIPDDRQLAISVDSMVEGVHFYAKSDPALIAHKLAAVNLSDMAAMGAEPKWATITLTLPNYDQAWLAAFSESLNKVAKQFELQIIGGDTTQGPLNISMQIMGLLPKGKALTRRGARLGQDVYVSNTLGDAALALHCIDTKLTYPEQRLERLRVALDKPQPQVLLGIGLLDIAHSCIDLSDGLIADLTHIAKMSEVSIEIDIERLPLSDQYQYYISNGGNVDLALTGGDDYQLAFTLESDRRAELLSLAKRIRVPVSKIGRVVDAQSEPVVTHRAGQSYTLSKPSGYQHFTNRL